MKEILFPTDFSDNTTDAFCYALHFADKLQARITTLHTYTIPVNSTVLSSGTFQEMEKNIEGTQFLAYQDFTKTLHDIAEQENLGNIDLNHILKQGFVVEQILDVSEEEGTDLILMASKGASGLKELFVGSKAASIASSSKCPILIIPEKAHYQSIKKIAYATNFDDLEEQVVLDLVEFADLFDAELHFIHVSFLEETWNKTKLDRLKDITWLENRLDNIHFHIVESENVVKGLEEYVAENQIDLIAMLKQKRTLVERLLLKSHTQEMALKTKVPLLIYG